MTLCSLSQGRAVLKSKSTPIGEEQMVQLYGHGFGDKRKNERRSVRSRAGVK